MQDDLDWVVIRPSRLLNTSRTGKYRTAVNILPPGGIGISRADLAEFIMKEKIMLFNDSNNNQYLDRVNSAFSDIEKWNDQNDYYPTPYSTFNEYMTWSVFTLYAYDRYKNDNFNVINQKTLDTMASRKFVLFEQFSDKLLELYLNKEEGETIPDLYTDILEWAESM